MTAHRRDWHRFVVECEPIEYESVTGYISRALASTAVASFPLAMRLAGVNSHFSQLNKILLRPDELHRLAYLLGTQPSRLRKLSLQDVSRVQCNPGVPRDQAVRRANSLAISGVRRVSPLGLREANFHRAAWDYSIYSFDPETLEPLMLQCPVCKVPLAWSIAGEPQYCDHCFDNRGRPTTDLRDYPQLPIEVEDAAALRFLGDITLPRTSKALDRLATQMPSVWSGVPYRSLCEIAVALAKLDSAPWRKRSPLSVEALTRAGRTILGGSAGVRGALHRIHEHVDPFEKGIVFQEMGGIAQGLIQQMLPGVKSDRSRYASVVKVDPAAYVAGRPDIQWRLQKVTLVDRVSRRTVPRVEPPWLWALRHSVPILQVSEMLGIEAAEVETLLRRGILMQPDPTQSLPGIGHDRILAGPLRLFMERLWRNAIEATDVHLPWIPLVSMHQFRERYPTLLWSSIMIALAESDIPRFRRHSKWPCWYYSLCVIDPHALYRQALSAEEQETKTRGALD